MGIGYTRQSSADIVDGLPITAAPLNNEFNALRDAFGQTNGHSHDGTSGEGPKLDVNESTLGTLPVNRGGTGATTASAARSNLAAAPLDSPSFTGTPAAPTAAAGTNTTQLANTAFVTSAVAAVPTTPIATGAELRALANNTKAVSPKAYGDAITFVPSTRSGSFNLDLNSAVNFDITLTGNSTFAIAINRSNGQSGTIIIRQDSTGGRTATWSTNWDFGPAGVPTLSSSANAVDYVFYQSVPITSDGTNTKLLATFRSGT